MSKQGRWAAVTGASRGIGRATALALAREGYLVLALARVESDLAALAAEHDGIVPVVMDIADEESRRTAVARMMAHTDGYGLDVLVNNAGYGQVGPVEDVSVDQVRKQFEVNVFGLLAFTQAFLPGMRERRWGRIVNVSSIAGRISTPYMGVYSASKYALEALSDALRVEVAPFGVRVVLIEPGPIRTTFGQRIDTEAVFLPDSPYAMASARFVGAASGATSMARSPQAVARLIVRAVAARRPRARYTITLPAKIGAVARRVLPDALWDAAMRVGLGQ